MAGSRDSESLASSAPTELKTMAYRYNLIINGVVFRNRIQPSHSMFFREQNRAAWQPLFESQSINLALHSCYRATLQDSHLGVVFAHDGFKCDELVNHAHKIVTDLEEMDMATERENGGWKRFIDKKLFEHYDFYNIFSSSQALQWSYDDWPEALARGQLVRPKPDFAFGLKLVLRSEENRLAQRLPLVSDPTISASCVPSDPMRLSFPFLVLESRSTQGDQLSTNHQMANDLIKSLDVIAAIGQEENLFSIGICQIGFSYEIYIGCSSTQNIPPDVPREYTLYRLSSGDLRSLLDVVRLLRFLEQAQHYGMNYFRRNVLQAIRVVCAESPIIPDMA